MLSSTQLRNLNAPTSSLEIGCKGDPTPLVNRDPVHLKRRALGKQDASLSHTLHQHLPVHPTPELPPPFEKQTALLQRNCCNRYRLGASFGKGEVVSGKDPVKTTYYTDSCSKRRTSRTNTTTTSAVVVASQGHNLAPCYTRTHKTGCRSSFPHLPSPPHSKLNNPAATKNNQRLLGFHEKKKKSRPLLFPRILARGHTHHCCKDAAQDTARLGV